MVQRKWITNDPIFETTNVSLACNTPGTPARAYIPILPGQSITAVYMYWVHTVGPMIAWMARCANDDCHTFDASTADWFKIGERGLQSGTIELGDWFQKTFSRWDGEPSLWSETIPRGLRKGRYLMRHEIISLHSANKPQFYPECAHLEIGGDGASEAKEEYLARIPGVWSMDRRYLTRIVFEYLAKERQSQRSISIFTLPEYPTKRWVCTTRALIQLKPFRRTESRDHLCGQESSNELVKVYHFVYTICALGIDAERRLQFHSAQSMEVLGLIN